MKWISILLACAGIMSLGFLTRQKSQEQPHNASKVINGEFTPVAVLELFTSEGCSSCPPAEKLLPQLATIDQRIIPLTFHVDYWNYLGWTDPFSNSQFSERQRQYVEQFKLQSAYTPQLVVNGKYELVGSNRGRAGESIKKALQEKSEIDIKISGVVRNGNKVRFVVKATGVNEKNNLEALLVQHKAVVKVKAGENSGVTLTHTSIVRSIATQSINKEANLFELYIPDEIADGGWSIAVIAKRNDDLRITGAIFYSPEK